MKLLLFAALAVLGVSTAGAQPLAEVLLPFTFPLSTTDPAAGADELAPFLDASRDARIVGLGEPTHGTAEVFQLKHRLIRRLVAEGGVQHVVLEASVTDVVSR